MTLPPRSRWRDFLVIPRRLRFSRRTLPCRTLQVKTPLQEEDYLLMLDVTLARTAMRTVAEAVDKGHDPVTDTPAGVAVGRTGSTITIAAITTTISTLMKKTTDVGTRSHPEGVTTVAVMYNNNNKILQKQIQKNKATSRKTHRMCLSRPYRKGTPTV
eukprot:PhF_6_TR6945/c1_g1_i1/m.10196